MLEKADIETMKKLDHKQKIGTLDETMKFYLKWMKELCKRDPIVEKLVNLFDGEVTTGSEIVLN